MTCREPVLQATTRPGGDYIFDGALWVPYLDKAKLVEEDTLQLREALDVLLAAIFLMNARFPQPVKKSWRIVSEVVYGLEGDDDPTPTEMALASLIAQDLAS